MMSQVTFSVLQCLRPSYQLKSTHVMRGLPAKKFISDVLCTQIAVINLSVQIQGKPKCHCHALSALVLFIAQGEGWRAVVPCMMCCCSAPQFGCMNTFKYHGNLRISIYRDLAERYNFHMQTIEGAHFISVGWSRIIFAKQRKRCFTAGSYTTVTKWLHGCSHVNSL